MQHKLPNWFLFLLWDLDKILVAPFFISITSGAIPGAKSRVASLELKIMGKLTQSIQELVGVIMVENGLHPDCELALISFGLDFVRMMQQDAKTFQVPDRDVTKTFYFEDQGYNSVALPANMIDIISKKCNHK